MSNDVVLSAALRNNLLSLQDTQSQIDTHQERLATGKKVNSALDNPQSFFAAQALTNAAGDLSNLLDSVGQSIQVINAANNGVTALTTLINQAQSIANSAQSTLAGSTTNATATGSTNLGTGKLTSITGITATSELQITVTNAPGTAGNAIAPTTVAIGANTTAADLVSSINDLNTALSTPAISASLNSSGQLVLTAVNGGSLNVKFGDSAHNNYTGVAAGDTTFYQNPSSALGFNGIAQTNQNGASATTSSVDFTQTPSSSLNSVALYSASGVLATASTKLSALTNSGGTAITTLANVGDTLNLSVGGTSSATNFFTGGGLNSNTQTIQGLVDGINNDATLKTLISASFNASTGQIVINPLTASATDVQIKFTGAAAGEKFPLFGTSTFAPASGSAATEDLRFGAAAGTLASLQTQYNTVLTQITALTTDTGYAGTNLLAGNNLQTFFNANRTSSLTTQGATFTASGLGLTTGNFQSASSITSSITATQNALTTVRNFGSTLANNLSIIQNRQTFLTSQINTLQTGSDALTNADQNTEGADLLALQTRQSLGITSLSLASQAQQAILKLF